VDTEEEEKEEEEKESEKGEDRGQVERKVLQIDYPNRMDVTEH